MKDEATPQSKGGLARAKTLSPNERKEIASSAARARWAKVVPTATHVGVLRIADLELPCFVLSDGRRVISGRGMTTAIGMKGRGQGVTRIATHPNIKGKLSNSLAMAIQNPIKFAGVGGRETDGFEATTLNDLCEAILQARDAGDLKTEQDRRYAQFADMLTRSFARIGIIALVDEATGYQKVRARDELQTILAAYISPDLLPWAKRFPDNFYEHLHRVRGWPYAPGNNARNAYIGKLTNALIYEQLPRGVLEDLRAKNPRDPNTKRRKHTHHELLTSDVGHPHLDKQILAVTTLLSVSDDWAEFTKLFSRKFPPGPGDLFALPAPGEDESA